MQRFLVFDMSVKWTPSAKAKKAKAAKKAASKSAAKGKPGAKPEPGDPRLMVGHIIYGGVDCGDQLTVDPLDELGKPYTGTYPFYEEADEKKAKAAAANGQFVLRLRNRCGEI